MLLRNFVVHRLLAGHMATVAESAIEYPFFELGEIYVVIISLSPWAFREILTFKVHGVSCSHIVGITVWTGGVLCRRSMAIAASRCACCTGANNRLRRARAKDVECEQ